MTNELLPKTVVGSYVQPEWLFDRNNLKGRLPPRVRAQEIWRVDPEFLESAQNDATLSCNPRYGKGGDRYRYGRGGAA